MARPDSSSRSAETVETPRNLPKAARKEMRLALESSVTAKLSELAASRRAALEDDDDDALFRAESSAGELFERLYTSAGVRTELLELFDPAKIDKLSDQQLEGMGSVLRSLFTSAVDLPMSDIQTFVQDLNAAERKAEASGRGLARECLRSVKVHLVEEGSTAGLSGLQMWTVDGRSYDAPLRVDGKNVFIGPQIPVDLEPCAHIVLSLDQVARHPRLHFLLVRPDPTQPLTAEELERLDLRRLSSRLESETIVTIRLDAKGCRDWQGIRSRGAACVERSLGARRGIRRGKEREASGSAVGSGVRKDQRGGLGPYENLKKKDIDYRALAVLMSSERRLTDIVMAAASVVVPGWTEELVKSTAAGGFPPTSRSGIATQAAAMKAWDAKSHIEPSSDPMLTGTIGFGPAGNSTKHGDSSAQIDSTDPPPPEAGFAFPTMNGENGVVLESGMGSLFFFSGKRYPHGTSHRVPTTAMSGIEQDNTPVSCDVRDLLAQGILEMDVGDGAAYGEGPREAGGTGVAHAAYGLHSPILSSNRLKALANIPYDLAKPPDLPSRSLLRRQAAPKSLGFCCYPKDGNFEYQDQRQFDLEKRAMKTKGIGTGRWSYATRSLGNSGSAKGPISPPARPLGRLVAESGDLGEADGAATISFEPCDIHELRARFAQLPPEKLETVTEILHEGLPEPIKHKRKRKRS